MLCLWEAPKYKICKASLINRGRDCNVLTISLLEDQWSSDPEEGESGWGTSTFQKKQQHPE